MLDELVELLEAALVEEQVDPLPSRELAFGVLALAALGAAAFLGPPVPVAEAWVRSVTGVLRAA